MSLNYSNIHVLLYSQWIRHMYKYWLVCSEKQIKFHGGIQKERESDISSGGPAATPLSRVRQIKRSPPNQRINCWPGLSNPRFLCGQRHCLQTPGTAPLCIFYYYVYYFVRGWVEVGDCPNSIMGKCNTVKVFLWFRNLTYFKVPNTYMYTCTSILHNFHVEFSILRLPIPFNTSLN